MKHRLYIVCRYALEHILNTQDNTDVIKSLIHCLYHKQFNYSAQVEAGFSVVLKKPDFSAVQMY